MNTHCGLNSERQTHTFLTQDVGNETLVYNQQTHQAFCLNPVATETWRRFDGLQTPAAIAAAAAVALRTPVSEEAVLLAISELRGHGLIEAEAPVNAGPGPSRRDLMRQIGAGAILMLPAVAVVMAPKAAQAYNGCVNCGNAVRERYSMPVAPRTPAANPGVGFVPVSPDTSDSTDDVRKKRRENGEIWIP